MQKRKLPKLPRMIFPWVLATAIFVVVFGLAIDDMSMTPIFIGVSAFCAVFMISRMYQIEREYGQEGPDSSTQE